MSMQPFTLNQQIIVEKRDEAGMLIFTEPQPPVGNITFGELYNMFLFETGPNAIGSWPDLSAWLSSKGWSVRTKNY